MPGQPQGLHRRSFLQATFEAGLAAVANAGQMDTGKASGPRRLILVLFGGGTRSSETIDDPAGRHIPHLTKELIPRGTLWANMRVEHLVVHPNCNAAIKTGHWEYEDLDWSRPPAHPTIFEIVRAGRGLPDTAAWSFVYASILANTGRSRDEGFGDRYAANVVEPPTVPRRIAEEMARRMAAAGPSREAQLAAAADCATLARNSSAIDYGGLRSEVARAWLAERFRAWKAGSGTTSHDVFLADCAIDCMKRFAPHVMSVDFGEIDCAHYGSWSRYVEAIERTDEQVWRLWQTVESLADYRDQTLMLVMPDHGRELERTGGLGYVHHSDFYTGKGADEGCRHVWMLALGPGVKPGVRMERPVPITSAAATGLEYLGLPISPGSAPAAPRE